MLGYPALTGGMPGPEVETVSQPNPIQMQKYLAGVDYPCGKDDLVRHAREKGADDEVMRHLENIPDRTYDGPNAVSAEFSKS